MFKKRKEFLTFCPDPQFRNQDICNPADKQTNRDENITSLAEVINETVATTQNLLHLHRMTLKCAEDVNYHIITTSPKQDNLIHLFSGFQTHWWQKEIVVYMKYISNHSTR